MRYASCERGQSRTLLKPTEVAALLNVSSKTVYLPHDMGMIEGVKIGDRIQDIHKFLASNGRPL